MPLLGKLSSDVMGVEQEFMKTTAAVGAFEIEVLELFQSQVVETGYACPFIDCKDSSRSHAT